MNLKKPIWDSGMLESVYRSHSGERAIVRLSCLHEHVLCLMCSQLPYYGLRWSWPASACSWTSICPHPIIMIRDSHVSIHTQDAQNAKRETKNLRDPSSLISLPLQLLVSEPPHRTRGRRRVSRAL